MVEGALNIPQAGGNTEQINPVDARIAALKGEVVTDANRVERRTELRDLMFSSEVKGNLRRADDVAEMLLQVDINPFTGFPETPNETAGVPAR